MTPVYVSGDTNGDGWLDLSETWVYTASASATIGDYLNTGYASASYTDDLGAQKVVNAQDTSSYFGANPAIIKY